MAAIKPHIKHSLFFSLCPISAIIWTHKKKKAQPAWDFTFIYLQIDEAMKQNC